MKHLSRLICALTLTLALGGAVASAADSTEAQATYKDIQKAFGFVPTFMKSYPEAGISAAWDEMKSVQLSPDTALSAKLKDLIGLSIAAQIPCKYCTYFHTEAATKLGGASMQEVRESVAMAAATRHWSTFLNGLQYDESEFRKEADHVMDHARDEMEKAKKNGGKTAAQPMVAVTDAQSAYADVERTLGSVPGFIKAFPAESVASAWKMMKSIQLNPQTMLSGKEKELIGLAVSAQIPCKFCSYFHTEAAKLNGASEREIHETLAMASVVRFWSTVLNGSQTDEAVFKREVAQLIRHVKGGMESTTTAARRAKK